MAAHESDNADSVKQPEKKGPMLYILLGVGGVALLSCCCCGAGGGTWWYVASQAAPAFVGNWETKSKEGDGKTPEITLMLIANGKGTYIRGDKLPQDFTWKTVDSKSVQFDMKDQTKTFWPGSSRPVFTYVVDGNSLTLTTVSDKRTTTFLKTTNK